MVRSSGISQHRDGIEKLVVLVPKLLLFQLSQLLFLLHLLKHPFHGVLLRHNRRERLNALLCFLVTRLEIRGLFFQQLLDTRDSLFRSLLTRRELLRGLRVVKAVSIGLGRAVLLLDLDCIFNLTKLAKGFSESFGTEGRGGMGGQRGKMGM